MRRWTMRAQRTDDSAEERFHRNESSFILSNHNTPPVTIEDILINNKKSVSRGCLLLLHDRVGFSRCPSVLLLAYDWTGFKAMEKQTRNTPNSLTCQGWLITGPPQAWYDRNKRFVFYIKAILSACSKCGREKYASCGDSVHMGTCFADGGLKIAMTAGTSRRPKISSQLIIPALTNPSCSARAWGF